MINKHYRPNNYRLGYKFTLKIFRNALPIELPTAIKPKERTRTNNLYVAKIINASDPRNLSDTLTLASIICVPVHAFV